MKTKIISLTIFILISNLIFAQNVTDTHIGGVYINNSYTQKQVENILGLPTKFETYNGESGVYSIYTYGNDKFEFLNDSNMVEYFTIKDKRFKLNDIVGIGDPVSKLYDLPKEVKKVGDIYYYDSSNDYYEIVICQKNDIITSISFSISL